MSGSAQSAEQARVPVALIERCLRLRNADGSHKVSSEARNIIRAAMDAHLTIAPEPHSAFDMPFDKACPGCPPMLRPAVRRNKYEHSHGDWIVADNKCPFDECDPTFRPGATT